MAALACCGLFGAASAGAQENTQAASATTPSCIDVEVDGQRTPSYECLTQKMSPKPTPSGAMAPALASEAIAQRPSNQLGLFNRSATSIRMGNTFGTSVHAQRPQNPVMPVIPRGAR